MSSVSLDALVEAKAYDAQQAVKDHALRQCLRAIDPQPSDYKLPYRQVLVRLAKVIARELQALGG